MELVGSSLVVLFRLSWIRNGGCSARLAMDQTFRLMRNWAGTRSAPRAQRRRVSAWRQEARDESKQAQSDVVRSLNGSRRRPRQSGLTMSSGWKGGCWTRKKKVAFMGEGGPSDDLCLTLTVGGLEASVGGGGGGEEGHKIRAGWSGRRRRMTRGCIYWQRGDQYSQGSGYTVHLSEEKFVVWENRALTCPKIRY